ncbi:MAG: pentapeptide repeat-containing protein [Ruminococcus sp.]|nr:pentapeptide repeat-containing protein [Ruminococcus sp.]
MDKKRIVTQEELNNACVLHNKYIEDEVGGKQAVFENCTFERLSFKGKQFNSAVFRNCEFRLCDMTDAGMCFAELNKVKFSGCDCTMFTAEEAAFRDVTFDKCSLKSAVFTHSSLRNIAFDKCETDSMSMQNCYELPEAEIIKIAPEELRKMSDKEGLILQGCGGELQEWADGINSALIDSDILKSPFDRLYVFENEGHTNIMFPFEDVELDIGKLAMWRLQTHEQFYGTWLSDYVPNRLGGFEEQPAQEQEKPDCPLLGQDSNIFNLMGIASKTLKRNGMAEQAKEMCDRITSSGDYNKALCIIGEYVNITSVDDDEPEESEDEEMEVTMD